jgi:hypothetical protein
MSIPKFRHRVKWKFDLVALNRPVYMGFSLTAECRMPTMGAAIEGGT